MQSGRNWASPARHRGSDSSHLHPRDPTDNHSQFQDITKRQTEIKSTKTVETAVMRIITLILSEDIIMGQSSDGPNNRTGQVVGGLGLRIDSTRAGIPAAYPAPPRPPTHPPPLPPAEGITSWMTAHSLKEKRMSLCKDDFSLFVLITRTTHTLTLTQTEKQY